MYRYVRKTPMATGQKYGDIVKDGELPAAVIERMLSSGSLTRISTPPLSELPPQPWAERIALLEQAGVITLSDLIKADEKKLSRITKKSPKIIRTWQSEAQQWLTNPQTLTRNND